MISEAEWQQATVTEGRALQEEGFILNKHAGNYLIWWRPEYVRASADTPDEDTVYIVEVR